MESFGQVIYDGQKCPTGGLAGLSLDYQTRHASFTTALVPHHPCHISLVIHIPLASAIFTAKSIIFVPSHHPHWSTICKLALTPFFNLTC